MTTTARHNLPHTSTEGLDHARREFAGDWDEAGTTSLSLPRETAHRFLERRGWTIGTGPRGGAQWVSPDGTFRSWHDEEAVAYAVAADAL